MKGFSYMIVTDSCANLPDALFAEYGIRVIPLVYIVDGRERLSYSKDSETNLKQYYDLMRKKVPMSTSCVSRENCEAAFTEILDAGKDVLYIGFSSALSATYDVASKVLEELKPRYPERKLIAVDSLSACLGQGMLVVEAAKRRAAGDGVEAAAEWARGNRLKAAHFFTVDTLAYLYKGGRLKKSAYLLATALNIKPVMRVNDTGHLEAIGKALGRKLSLNALAKHIAEGIEISGNDALYIGHGDCIGDVEYLIGKIRERVSVKDPIVNYVDLVIGVHSGPGTVAAFCFADKR
ncbi:MAG: DegV family protein [Clostridiales bacterium]|jgi:DegV family protein with EDD domain|nr:DegV family protein [Clostridiales bacterium]